MFKWFRKKTKGLFSFSWSFVLFLLAILLLFYGLHLAADAFKDDKNKKEWNLEQENPDSINDFLRRR
jgi:hypothetical protein